MQPVIFTWTDEGTMVPLSRFRGVCDKQFAVGERYPLVVEEGRSKKSHDHFFAHVEELWRTLPEGMADQFPSSEHLRKFALIRAGYCDQRSIVCSSAAEAARVAAFIRPMDEYSIVVVRGATVMQYTAHSQSKKAMGAKVFQQSKDAVFAVIAEKLGVAPETVVAQQGKAA